MIFSRNGTLLDACVLSALARGDTYGYELTARIRISSEVSESTLYPVLKRLEKENLLSTYDAPVNGRNRRYYSLTEAGREKLHYYTQEWVTFKETIDRALSPA